MADARATGKQAAVHKKRFDSPDQTRPFGRGKAEVVEVGGVHIGRTTHEPGWRWSEDIGPMAKMDRCEAKHVGYVVQGRLKVIGRDGSEGEVSAGDIFVLPPGHDAWTVGNEAVILLDFHGFDAAMKQK